MSYEIIDKVGAFKTTHGYVPFIISGSNNCRQYHNGRMVREKNIHFFNIFFKAQSVNKHKIAFENLECITENDVLDTILKDSKTTYKTNKTLLKSMAKNITDTPPIITFNSLYYYNNDINLKFKKYLLQKDLDNKRLDLQYYLDYFNSFLATLSASELNIMQNVFTKWYGPRNTNIRNLQTADILQFIHLDNNPFYLIKSMHNNTKQKN